jgi:transposase
MTRQRYTTDLTDAQWERLRLLLETPGYKGGRPREYPMREIVNALLYYVKNGCTWRDLPHDLPPWSNVNNHTSYAGRKTVCWSGFTTHYVRRFARPRAGSERRVPRCWMHSRCGRRKKGGLLGLRRRQTDHGAEAPHRGRHTGVDLGTGRT